MLPSEHSGPSTNSPRASSLEQRRASSQRAFESEVATQLSPQSKEICRSLFRVLSPARLQWYYGSDSPPQEVKRKLHRIIDFSLKLSDPGPLRREIDRHISAMGSSETQNESEHLIPFTETILDMDRRADLAFKYCGKELPLSIWDCCSRRCVASVAIDTEQSLLLEEISKVYRIAERLHENIEKTPLMIAARQPGIGGSNFAFVAQSRTERGVDLSTDRRKAIRQLESFAVEVVPFLYGRKPAPSGTPCPRQKFCAEAICCLLGVSRKFLYGRKRRIANNSNDEELSSIIDTSGVRLRQHRRVGKRGDYPEIDDLQSFCCGCSQPCMSGVPVWRLHNEFEEFSRLAKQLNPRRKENRYLLNVLFCPLLNSPIGFCDKSLSALYTVSEGLIADVRRVLQTMCDQPCPNENDVLTNGVDGYKRNPKHPMNRYSDQIREKVETHLDFILRADPGASDGVNTCRVYSPEINTQEKLRKKIAEHLEDDEDVDVQLSSSTLQRMVKDYLKARNCRISFLQSDHNACPNCKTLQYSLLQYSFELKNLRAERENLQKDIAQVRDSMASEKKEKLEAVEADLLAKEYQESCALWQAKEHNERDAEIRGFLKRLSDYFRDVENLYRNQERISQAPWGWRQRSDHAIITHQDDMSKMDLPHFVLSASSDITRWRYDVNAHVNAVNGDSIVFSHEQGAGPKNASSIMELILLDHVMRCRGEAIKVIVSDNAAVGKNWLTVVALPQYMVDQGLADIVMIVFLENNHGKWLADMLFGQLQTRKRRSTILGIDALLSEFESINRKTGSIQGFALNPLSCVNFLEVLKSLGYGTSPPKDFGFLKRNIHFATACSTNAREHLSVAVRNIIGDALPSEPGMVRISSGTPQNRPQNQVPYEKRYFDVPAASFKEIIATHNQDNTPEEGLTLVGAPLVVPLDKGYSPSGAGVVSYRNMKKVGYNGIQFRKTNACPEMRNVDSPLVKQTWPIGLLDRAEENSGEENLTEPLPCSESSKCAPENWILRRPVARFNESGKDIKARYPPRNMLNAEYQRPPRSAKDFVPTAMYDEAPVPAIEKLSAHAAFIELQESHRSMDKGVHVLDLMRCIYKNMADRENVNDSWLQRRVTIPSVNAVERYRGELTVFNEREKGHPKGPISLRMAHKNDIDVQKRVSNMLQGSGRKSGESEAKARTRFTAQLFEEAELQPGALDKYERLVEKYMERYARELKNFKEVTQQTFDEEHGIVCAQPNAIGEE